MRKSKLIKEHKKLKQKIKNYSISDIWGILHKQKEISNKKELFIQCLVFADILIEKELNFSLHDNQIIASHEIQKGNIIEMSTGEGKTYISLATCIYNILQQEHTYIITANSYLAKRDKDIYQKILSNINIIVSNLEEAQNIKEKKISHDSYIIFSTIKTLIFDYLYTTSFTDVSKKLFLYFDNIIIDEVDHILIDEARTPISAQEFISNDSFDYKLFYKIALNIYNKKEMYEIDYEKTNINLTEAGYNYFSNELIKEDIIKSKNELYKEKNIGLIFHIETAIKSIEFFKKNRHYIIKNNNVLVIDINSGRVVPGRRYQGYIHEYLEVKENCKINSQKNKILTTTTIQKFLNKFNHFSGMSGTVISNKKEFTSIYNKKCSKINDNKDKKLLVNNTLYFLNKEEKINSIVENTQFIRSKSKRPIMICTYDISESESIQKKLNKINISSNIINAKNHEKEANIIERAGLEYNITIATNMAGRGADITIGSNQKEKENINNDGGLIILISEHSPSKRYDLQLMGRTARQGQHGEVQFYSSIDDPIFNQLPTSKKIFLHRIKKNKQTDKLIDSTIESIQKKVEGKNHDTRMHFLRYDSIDEEQREVALKIRNKICEFQESEEFYKKITLMLSKALVERGEVLIEYMSKLSPHKFKENDYITEDIIYNILLEQKKKINNIDDLKSGLLRVYNNKWSDFLEKQEILKRKTILQASNNKKPESEYKIQTSILFEGFLLELFFSLTEYYIFYYDL